MHSAAIELDITAMYGCCGASSGSCHAVCVPKEAPYRRHIGQTAEILFSNRKSQSEDEHRPLSNGSALCILGRVNARVVHAANGLSPNTVRSKAFLVSFFSKLLVKLLVIADLQGLLASR